MISWSRWNRVTVTALAFALLLAMGVGGTSAVALAERAAVEEDEPANPAAVAEFTVFGHVRNSTGQAIPGAIVEWGSDQVPFKRRHQTATDKDGAYKLVVKKPDWECRLAASAIAHSTVAAGVDSGRSQQVCDFVLPVLPPNQHAVMGTVVDARGKPIAGVRVEAFTPVVGFYSSFSSPSGGDHFPGPDRVDTTDEQGQFRIADLPSEEVQLNFESRFRYASTANYPVKGGLRIEMSGSGLPGVVQARVVDAETGQPLENKNDVRVIPRYTTIQRECSGDDCHFRLPGEVTLGSKPVVYVYAKGYAATEAQVTSVAPDSKEFADIKLKKAPALRGKLVDATTGKPLKDVALLYGVEKGNAYVAWSDLGKYADGYHPLHFVQHVMSDKAGEFWFAEPADSSRGMIVVYQPGYQRFVLKPESREIDKSTGELVVRLKRESAFTGVVYENVKPLSGASVSVWQQAEHDPREMSESAHTDWEGKYRYGRLTPGEYRISGGSYTRMAKVSEGETVTVNLGTELGELRIQGIAEPGVTIGAHPEFEWDYRTLETRADEAGQFELSGLKPGKYSLMVNFPFRGGFHRQSRETMIDVQRDGQEIDLRQSQRRNKPDPAASKVEGEK